MDLLSLVASKTLAGGQPCYLAQPFSKFIPSFVNKGMKTKYLHLRALDPVAATITVRWRWKKWLPDRFGQLCRVLAVGKLNSALVQFEDGYKAVTSRYAVRRVSVMNAVFGESK